MSKSKNRSQRRVEGVALTGSVSEWDKLPARIRTLVKNNGLMRLSQIRNQIAADAGLPMPKIYVVPYCWNLLENYGPIYALVRPTPRETVDGKFEFSVTTTAATLIVVQDDTILRRILCHEFSHCFYTICRLLEAEKTGTGGPEIIVFDEPPKSMSERLDKDRERLINPEEWFGQWDAEHFIFGEDKVLSDSTRKLVSSWINLDLPCKTPNQLFEAHDICIEDEIVEHIRKLDSRK